MFEKLFKYPSELYRQGELGFSVPIPTEARLLLVLALAALVWWMYGKTRQSVSPARRKFLIVVRALTVAVLVAMVLRPVLRLPKLKSDETFVVLMLDTSKSMTIEDSALGGTRFDSARKLLFGMDGRKGLADDLSASFAVRTFSLDEGARRVRDPNALKPEGERTGYFRSLREVDQEMRGATLAAVVVLSDGGNNGSGSPVEMAEHFKTQDILLYTVGFGNSNPPKDYEIVRVAVPRQVRRNAQVEAFATVRCTGFKQPFTVFLRQGEAILSNMDVRPQENKDMYQVRFTFYPEKEGAQKYNLFIKPGEGEKVTDNNQREFLVDVVESRLPVLYVEGSPRTEFRFIRRALFRDQDFRIVSLLRTGHGRFYVQGADDMPELQKGYPTNKDLLFKFEAVVFGDIEAGFFTPEQLKMTEEFVKERGGGFAMLGGVNSFNLGNYKGTSIEQMLPVLLQDSKNAYSFDRFKMQVPEGALKHPILHQDDDLEENKRAWDRVPELDGYNHIKGAKTAAQVLAVNPKSNQPVLAVQNYGRGRVAAFCTGGSWAWRMAVTTEIEIQEKFWRQLVRWLAVGSKESVSLALDRDVYAKGEPVILRATVLGNALEAVNDAKVKAVFLDPFGNSEEIDMPWTLTRDGVYQCRYETREHGDHKVTVRVEMPKLKPIEVGTSFSVTHPFHEFNNTGLNEGLLRKMAETAGGQYFNEKDADGLAPALKKLLERRERAGSFVEEKDLWDAPIFFLLLVVFLGVEWSVRRRGGLA